MSTSPLRIGVFGAGAIGCYVGARLLGHPQVELVFLGRDRIQTQVRESGLTWIDQSGNRETIGATEVAIDSDPQSLSSCELILCCVKSGQTADAATTIAEVTGPDTIVCSLQNGTGNATVLRKHLGPRPVLAGIVEFNVVWSDGAEFRQSTKGDLVLEHTDDPRLATLVRALSEQGLSIKTHADMAPHQWAKLVVNLNNAIGALSGAPTRELLLDRGYRRIVADVIAEGLGVLKAAGINPAPMRGIPLHWFPRILRLPTALVRVIAAAQFKVDPEARSSMWQDLAAGRVTEVDYLNGAIVALAHKHGVSAPINQRIVELIGDATFAEPPTRSAQELAAALRATPTGA